jgi:hypothetical protein
VREVAELFGVVPHTVSTWIMMNRMPEPYVRLASGPIWTRQQIEAIPLQRGPGGRGPRVAVNVLVVPSPADAQ